MSSSSVGVFRNEGLLQSAMGPLDHPIQLMMVGGRGVHPGAHGLQGAGEGATGELEPTVGDHIGRNAETADPMREEGAGDCVGVDRGEGDCLKPPGQPLNHREQVGHSLALGKGPDYVQVDAVETSSWRG